MLAQTKISFIVFFISDFGQILVLGDNTFFINQWPTCYKVLTKTQSKMGFLLFKKILSYLSSFLPVLGSF